MDRTLLTGLGVSTRVCIYVRLAVLLQLLARVTPLIEQVVPLLQIIAAELLAVIITLTLVGMKIK